jgi:hypothetical protein
VRFEVGDRLHDLLYEYPELVADRHGDDKSVVLYLLVFLID